MSMISPETFYNKYIKYKSEKEFNNKIQKLTHEIKKSEIYIKEGKVRLSKPNNYTLLEVYNLYLEYINKMLNRNN